MSIHPLKEQKVLVTGATSPLGRAICLQLHQRGAEVIVHYRTRPADLDLFVDSLTRPGGGSPFCVQADLTKPDELDRLFRRIGEELRGLDSLVNNAGVYLRRGLLDTTTAELEQILAVNVVAPMSCIQGAVALGASRIVNIADIAWNKSWAGHAAYIASKAAFAALSRIAAVELAPDVRVNAIAPGLISLPDDGEKRRVEKVEARIPMQRRGRPDEVAQAVAWLLEAPDYITGGTLYVDGGLSLR